MELAGLPLRDLDDGATPLSAVAVVHYLDPRGHQALAIRYTTELPLWQVIGMLDAALATARSDLSSNWVQDDEDDD